MTDAQAKAIVHACTLMRIVNTVMTDPGVDVMRRAGWEVTAIKRYPVHSYLYVVMTMPHNGYWVGRTTRIRFT